MNSFKEGDLVWCFTTRNPKDTNDIEEHWGPFNLKGIHLSCVEYDELWEDKVSCYATKVDAIKSIKIRINAMEHQNE